MLRGIRNADSRALVALLSAVADPVSAQRAQKNRPLYPCCPLSSRDEAAAHQVEIGVPGFCIARDGQILLVAIPLPTRGTDLSPGSLFRSRFREAFLTTPLPRAYRGLLRMEKARSQRETAYAIALADCRIMALAGLPETWHSGDA